MADRDTGMDERRGRCQASPHGGCRLLQAGYGGITEETFEEYREVPLSLTGGRRDVLLLRIKGESMLKAGFNPGDLAIVVPQTTAFNGDIVIAFDPEDGTETIKRFKKLKNYVALLPETDDPNYKPKIGTHFQIQGKVIGKL